jgi:hybrid cluster-associated redox disulfide protein
MPRDTLAQALPDMPMAELMRRWPDTVPLLLRRRMACPGCLMAPFMTVAEAAREHAIEPDELVGELAALLAAPAEADPRKDPRP